MTPELLLALTTFALVASMTPGPNTLMLMASGANFGFRRTLPHMVGVSVGFVVMVFLVGVGLMQLFDAWPMSYTLLKGASIAYLLWLAWKIATAGQLNNGTVAGKPLGFWQAAGFQWVNPKAWAVSLATISAYAPGFNLGSITLIAAVFAAASLPATTVWTLLGREISRFLKNPGHLRLFNWAMAALLVATLYPVLFS